MNSSIFPSDEELRASLRAARDQNSSGETVATLQLVIDLSQQLLQRLDRTKSLHGMLLVDVAALLSRRWILTKSDVDWESAVAIIDHELAQIPQDDWRFPLYVLAKGTLFAGRADHTGSLADRDEACQWLERARGGVRPGAGVHGTSSLHLALLRLQQFECDDEPLLLEAALQDAVSAVLSSQIPAEQFTLAARTLGRAVDLKQMRADQVPELDLAVAALRKALEIGGREMGAGNLQSAMGSVLKAKFNRDHEQADINEAIEQARAALAIPGLPDDLRSMRHENLANALSIRFFSTAQLSDLDEAIDHLRSSLDRISPPRRLRTSENLARLLIKKGLVSRRQGLVAEALESLRVLLDNPSLTLEETELVGGSLLDAALSMDHLVGNTDLLDEAIAGGAKAFAASMELEARGPVTYRLRDRAQTAALTRRLVGALINRAGAKHASRDLYEAIKLSEAIKVPILSRELLRRSLPAPDGVDDGSISSEKRVLAELAALDVHELAPTRVTGDARRLRRVRLRQNLWTALDRVWSEIAASGTSGEAYVAARRDPTVALENVLGSRPADWLILSAMEFDEMSASGEWQRQTCILGLWPSDDDAKMICRTSSELVRTSQERFVAEVLSDEPVAETWFEPLSELLVGKNGVSVSQIVLSLTPQTQALPWELLFQRSGWIDVSGASLPTVIVPSLICMLGNNSDNAEWDVLPDPAKYFPIDDPDGLLENVRVTMPSHARTKMGPLVVGNPKADLKDANSEAQSIAAVLGIKPLMGTRATTEAVRVGLRSSNIVHVAAHVTFDKADARNSVIHLADGDLSARDIIGWGSSADLIVLSACDSGSGLGVIGGEILGLATALFGSGAKAIVASMWPVDDAATAYLMKKFYQARIDGLSNLHALARAKASARAQPGWARPYFWAGFVLSQRGWTI